jgi:hypothetical protein
VEGLVPGQLVGFDLMFFERKEFCLWGWVLPSNHTQKISQQHRKTCKNA